MRRSVLIKVATQSILKNKLRMFLTMLGIVIGVAAVIIMVAIGSGAQSTIQQQVSNLGTNMTLHHAGRERAGRSEPGRRDFQSPHLAGCRETQARIDAARSGIAGHVHGYAGDQCAGQLAYTRQWRLNRLSDHP